MALAVCNAPLPTPFTLGPTWQKNPDGSWHLPKLTLGWSVIEWVMDHLMLDGEPITLTLEQQRFILWMYAIDTRGRFIYREIVLQRMKGAGKDPLAAILSAVEFVGPCRFSHWATEWDVEAGNAEQVGDPVAQQQVNAWVQITAVTEDQTKNTMAFMPTIFSKECIQKYGIDLGKQVTYALGGRRLEITTGRAASMEGNRPTFAVRNETHHWTSATDGVERGAVIRRNLAKIKNGQARALSITNAYRPGEDSVAEKQRLAYLATIEKHGWSDVMYDSLEAPIGSTISPTFTGWDEQGNEVIELQPDGTPVPPSAEVVKEHLRRILTVVRGDAVWLDVDRLVAEILAGDTSTEDAKRFYFNSVNLGDDTAFDPEHIRATSDQSMIEARRANRDPLRCSWEQIGPDEPVVLFGDGSKSDDSTAIIGCRVSDGYVFTVGVWQRPNGERGRHWLAPRDEIDARVHEAFERFNVVAFFFDPSHTVDEENANRYWDTLIDGWHVKYGDQLTYWAVQTGDRRSAIMWDMTSPTRQTDFVMAVERFTDELESHVFIHDAHPTLVDHMRNARSTMTKYGWSISKMSRSSRKKIDAAVCAVGARMLRRLVMIKGSDEAVPTGITWAPVD